MMHWIARWKRKHTKLKLAALVLVAGLLAAYPSRHDLMARRLAAVGDSPDLHRAIAIDNLWHANLLLGFGADPNLAGAGGNRPLHFVESAAGARLLLKYSADPNALNDQRESPLHTVASAGAVMEMLAAGASISVEDEIGETPLHDAKNAAVARLYLKAGALVDARDRSQQTPLHVAQSPEIAELLISQGADMEAENALHQPPLHLAKTPAIADRLIASGAELETIASSGLTPLHTAKNPEMIRFFVGEGCDVNATNRWGETPLMRVKNSAECAKILIDLGADLDTRSASGASALTYALDHPQVLEVLVAAGADYRSLDPQGQSLFDVAITRFGVTGVEWLIDAGVDIRGGKFYPSHRDVKWLMKAGAVPRLEFLRYASPDTLEYLKSVGVDLNSTDELGRTALFYATFEYNVDTLLDLGLDPAVVDKEGKTALDTIDWRECPYGSRYYNSVINSAERMLQHCSAVIDLDALAGRVSPVYVAFLIEQGAKPAWSSVVSVLQARPGQLQQELLQRLLDAGVAPVSQADLDAAAAAVANHPIEVIEMLSPLGVKLDLGGEKGCRALGACAGSDRVAFLIKEGASVKSRDRQGKTPLHLGWERQRVLKALVEAGADPNAQDQDGNTPLHLVARSMRRGQSNEELRERFSSLCEAGADPKLENRSGQTAEDYVAEARRPLVLPVD